MKKVLAVLLLLILAFYGVSQEKSQMTPEELKRIDTIASKTFVGGNDTIVTTWVGTDMVFAIRGWHTKKVILPDTVYEVQEPFLFSVAESVDSLLLHQIVDQEMRKRAREAVYKDLIKRGKLY